MTIQDNDGTLGESLTGLSSNTPYDVYVKSICGTDNESIWAGPLGGVVRFLCFHPHTTVKLKNGIEKKMKNIEVGDVLRNNSKVLGKLELQGSEVNPYYKIYSIKLKNWIYVTGSHLIQDPTTSRFIEVSKMKDAIKTTMYTKRMNCLITDDHLIPVGEYTFWDWEDGN